MPRQAQPNLNLTWKTEPKDDILERFLACDAGVRHVPGFPKDASHHAVIIVGFDQITGTIEQVRQELLPTDQAELKNLQLQWKFPAVTTTPQTQGHLNLGVDTKAGSVTVSARHLSPSIRATELIEALKIRLPEASQPAPPVPPPTPPGARAMRVEPVGEQIARKPGPGLVIDHYRLVQRLGAGFSSEVWKAEVVSPPSGVALKAGEAVAIKLYAPHVLMQTADTLRIHREFQVAFELRHDSLVRVYDLMIAPSRPLCTFLVMEYVAGVTLKSKIPQSGFAWQECARIGQQIASALNELHGAGALHRDIKPANIMIESDSPMRLKLLDLGIVTLTEEKSLTQTSMFVGSKHTSSPEQLLGEDIDERTDVYALGASLYQCYHGRPLYEREGPATAIVLAMHQRPQECMLKNGTASEAGEKTFVNFVNRCISRDPANRPSTARQCLDELERIMGNEVVAQPAAVVESDQDIAPSQSSTIRPAKPPRMRVPLK